MARRRIIASHVSRAALGNLSWRALEGLGYGMVPLGESSGRPRGPVAPDLRIVDAEDLEQIVSAEGASVPIIVLTREHAPTPADPRVVASLPRFAPFKELFAAIQKTLESTPRRHPRIATALAARCAQGDRTHAGAVISLSEGGCLFRSSDEISWEPEAILQFPLPRSGLMSTHVRHVHQTGNDLGLAFRGIPPQSRSAIARYVMDQLVGS